MHPTPCRPALRTAALVAAVFLPSLASAQATHEVAAEKLNVRAAPSASAKKLGYFKQGTELRVYAVSGSWARINPTKNHWVHGGYLRRLQASQPRRTQREETRRERPREQAAPASSASYEVATEALNVRSGPSASAGRVGTVRRGDRVQVYETRGSWVRIHPAQQRWVHAGYLQRAGAAPASSSRSFGTETTVHQFQGRDSERGNYAMAVRLAPRRNGQIEVTRVANYRSDRREQHSGFARADGNKIAVRLRGKAGMRGALAGDGTDAVDLWLTLGDDGLLTATDRSTRGQGQAKETAPSEASDAGADGDEGPEASQRGRHLLAVAGRAIGRRVGKGISVSPEIKLHDYLHVGLGAGIEAVGDGAQTAAMKAGRRAGHTWLRSFVQGGVRVPLKTSIPLGDSLALVLGFEAGARVDYTVIDLYPTPNGARSALQALRRAAARSFDLPLSAGEARAMNVGAERIFEGRAHVALSGKLRLGNSTRRDGVLQLGATAEVGGFYRLAGRARIRVERLQGAAVRVRFTRARSRSRGAEADLLLQASLDRTRLKQELQPAVEYVDDALIEQGKLTASQRAALIEAGQEATYKAANGVVKKALKVRVRGRAAVTNSQRFDLAYVFDLRRAAARAAYERAVRGDFRAAARSAGVRQDYRVVDIEKTTAFTASLELSVLFKASFHNTLRLQRLNVQDGSGVTQYEVTDAEKGFETRLLNRESSRSANLELIRSTRGDSLHYVLERVDPGTTSTEVARFQRLLLHWGLNPNSGLPIPEPRALRSRFGKTRTRLELWLAHDGLNQALAQDRSAFLRAYTQAWTVIHDETPLWATKAGRSRIDSAGGDDDLDAEKRELRQARRYGDKFDALRRARSHTARGRALRALTSGDLVVIAAIVDLAPRSALSVDASLEGKRVRVKDGVQGVDPVRVRDPR